MVCKFRLLFLPLLLAVAGQVHATTYYVTTSGSDGASGLSWSQAWATVDKVNATLLAGDTVRFGSGQFLGGKILPPAGGTFSKRTVYACSTLSSNSWYKTTISSGELITGWSVNSGNIYQASYVGYDCYGDNDNSYAMTQGGVLLIPRESRAAITQPGMFYHDGSTIYAWLYNNGNPNSQEMLATCRPTVHFRDHSQAHILFYGLNLRLGKQGVVVYSAGADSVFFERCKFYGSGQSNGENPALIQSRHYDATPHNWGEYNTYRNCTFSGVYPVAGDPPIFGTSSYLHRGSGAILYTQRYTTFDSCLFYDLPGPGVYIKNGIGTAGTNRSVGNVIKFCTFQGGIGMAGGVVLGADTYADSVYGCIFTNTVEGAIRLQNTWATTTGKHFIGNNTFYNCNLNVWISHPVPDSTTKIYYNVGYERWVGAPTNWINGTIGFWYTSPDVESKHDIDSNIWYSSAPFSGEVYGTAVDWTGWTEQGFDVNSKNVDPILTNPAGGDFSRQQASGEMDVSYGGQTWTVFGAIQEPCWSLASNFLVGPPDTDTISLPALLQWQTHSGGQYQVQVSGNAAFSGPEIDEVVASTSRWTSGLVEGRTYFWRVRAFDPTNGWSCWSSSRSFTAECPSVPGTPSLVSPANGESGLSQPVNLKWDTVIGASKYELELDQEINFGNSQTFVIIGNNNYYAGNLISGTDYYWRVRACNSCGCGTYSQPRYFSANPDTTTTGEDNLAAGRPPTVDGTYSGYSTASITDGVINPRGGSATTWSSEESQSNSHWIEIDFNGSVQANAVNIHWAWNNGVGAWTTSQQFTIEGWVNDTTVVTLANLSNNPADSISTVNFSPTEVRRLRITQPANGGSALYPTVIWLTELEVLGGQDTIPPAAVQDLSALPGSNHGEIDLSWRASGNDGMSGMADHYAVQARLSQFPNQGAITVNFPGVETAGLPESNTFSGLTPGAKYDLTVTAYDPAGLKSAPVSVTGVIASGILKPPTLYTELDSISGSVTVSCDAVESYYPQLSYDFEVATDSLFLLPNLRTLAAVGSIVGPEIFLLVDPESDHYWHCRAVSYNPADSSDWSRVIGFNIATGTVYQELATGTSPNVRAGPSPVNFVQGQFFSFFLPTNPVNLIIMDMAGARVLQREGISGLWQWDGRTSGGSRVAAGIYLWYVHDGDLWQHGKIMVQS